MKQTNNILVIGNGFDLACNYDTRYIDFVNFIKMIRNEEDKILVNNNHIKDFITRYKKNKKDIENITEFRELQKIANDNAFIKHFIKLNYDINIWSDVEEEMHRIIRAINDVFNDENLDQSLIRNAHASRVLCLDYDNEYVKTVMNEFELIESEYIHFNDARLKPLNTNYYDYVYKIKWKNLCDYLNKQLDSFKEALIIYLEKFVPVIKDLYFDEKIENQLEKINPSQIITFNYTDYYNEYYDCDVIHIHGSLKERKIVLGFEDDAEISLKYCRFFKYFQRIQYKLQIIKKTDSIFNKPLEQNEVNGVYILGGHKTNIIYFYGVSFDITDDDYIKELYGSDKDKVIVYYYDDEDYNTKIINLIKIFDKDKITNDIHSGKLTLTQISKSK